MSGIFEALNNSFTRFMTNAARNRLRHNLLSRSDRFLDDIGVSRELLEEGVGAWPWKTDDAPEPALKLMTASAGAGKNLERANGRELRNSGHLLTA